MHPSRSASLPRRLRGMQRWTFSVARGSICCRAGRVQPMAIHSQNIEAPYDLNKVGGIARWRTTPGAVPAGEDAPVWAEPDWNRLRVPANGIADLWKCDLEFEVERNFSLLSADEKERAARFHFALHRRRYIAAHGCLRRILGAYLRLDPREVVFARNNF